jgi:hypothetical protein
VVQEANASKHQYHRTIVSLGLKIAQFLSDTFCLTAELPLAVWAPELSYQVMIAEGNKDIRRVLVLIIPIFPFEFKFHMSCIGEHVAILTSHISFDTMLILTGC